MVRSIRGSRGGVLACALSLMAGCAQFQWSSNGPGAPGKKDPVLPAPSARTNMEPLPDLEGVEPFRQTDRDRIATVQPWVEQIATKYELDPDLINGVIWVESRFQTRAKSPAGARGLMQLMPATANAMARQMGRSVARVYDPEFNIEAGSLYLLKMLDRYDGDETLALAAYNAGGGNVSKWMREDGELPPRSIRYVEHVQHARLRFIALRDPNTQLEEDRTMIAAAPVERRPEVPSPPGAAQKPQLEPDPEPRVAPKPEPEPEPKPEVVNPLAPSPDVYRPEPTPEPPLADTPNPPTTDHSVRPDAKQPVKIAKPGGLPSVLD
ncbi:MAG: lytic transglycosylase domain-containing protein [Myxococcota bacterium]